MKALRILFLLITLAVVFFAACNLTHASLATLNYNDFTAKGWLAMNPDLDIQGAETFAAHLGSWAPASALPGTIVLLVVSCCILLINRYWWTGWITMLLASLTIITATADRMKDTMFNDSMGLLIQRDDITMTIAVCIAVTCVLMLLLKVLHMDRPLMRITSKK